MTKMQTPLTQKEIDAKLKIVEFLAPRIAYSGTVPGVATIYVENARSVYVVDKELNLMHVTPDFTAENMAKVSVEDKQQIVMYFK